MHKRELSSGTTQETKAIKIKNYELREYEERKTDVIDWYSYPYTPEFLVNPLISYYDIIH